MSFYVNNENVLCIFLFLFYLEGEQVFVQLQVQGTLSLQLVFVICQSFFSLDNISSNSINYKSGDLHNLPWMRMLKSQILATCCQRTASSKVGGKDGFAENFIIKGILKICADNNGLLDWEARHSNVLNLPKKCSVNKPFLAFFTSFKFPIAQILPKPTSNDPGILLSRLP